MLRCRNELRLTKRQHDVVGRPNLRGAPLLPLGVGIGLTGRWGLQDWHSGTGGAGRLCALTSGDAYAFLGFTSLLRVRNIRVGRASALTTLQSGILRTLLSNHVGQVPFRLKYACPQISGLLKTVGNVQYCEIGGVDLSDLLPA
jgi:hypothetical protein